MKNPIRVWGGNGHCAVEGQLNRPVRWILLACVCLLASCATTKMTETWKDDQFKGTIRKVAVIGVFKEPETRKIFEDEFATRLRAHGIAAVASHKFIPDAKLPDKDFVIEKIRSLGEDTVIVTRILDSETAQTVVPGRSYIVPNYYTTYGVYYTQIYQPAYTVTEGYAYAETNLYSVNDEKLIWSGRSKTNLSATRYELIQAFVKLMIDRLSDDQLIRE